MHISRLAVLASRLIHFFLFSISAFSYSFTGTVLFTRLVVLLSGDAMWETTTRHAKISLYRTAVYDAAAGHQSSQSQRVSSHHGHGAGRTAFPEPQRM